MKVRNLVLSVAVLLLLAGCASMGLSKTETARTDVLYTCNCGPGCQCNTVSTTPGKCACGNDLKWGHVLQVEGSEAVLCRCEKGCRCQGLDTQDPTKCACGQPVKRVDLAGTGIHFCNCGGSCKCNMVNQGPGQCRCGMKLKTMD